MLTGTKYKPKNFNQFINIISVNMDTKALSLNKLVKNCCEISTVGNRTSTNKL